MKVKRSIKVRKLNMKAVAMMIAALLVVVTILVTLIFNPFSKYPKYMTRVSNEYKKIGHHEVIKEATDDRVTVLHYPALDNEKVNTWIQEFTNQSKERSKGLSNKDGKKAEIFQDYSIYQVHDKYVTVDIKTSLNSEITDVISRTYDIESGEFVKASDLFNELGLKKLISDVRATLSKPKEMERQSYLKATSLDEDTALSISKSNVVFNIKGFNKPVSFDLSKITDYFSHSIGSFEKTNGEIAPVYLDRGIDPKEKMVAFTFDDGPHHRNTQLIMDEMDKYDGQATFFMLGERVNQNPSIVKEIVSRGHQIANHSFTHPDFNSMDIQDVNKEIKNTEEALFKASGLKGPFMVRPPYGNANAEVRKGAPVTFVNWSVDSEDWVSRDPQQICNTIDKYKHDGAIILLHDIYESSYEGFKCAAKKLHDQGYKFVTVEELLESRNDIVKTNALYFNADPIQ
ncbi:polysaccharide deacetylase family protein [Erysipelothrix rhusiopathiae]|uniref:Polysaccharide deacetylase n=2 Tax=Erysipelothrix rhusiopathiae TaxID=1648 RepID=E7FUU6_ERYRH|nr:polysaccharide deacetylase family protein [Erysipelothrix rhusiopathiae]AGN24120.1 polysaccharide deacetylase [Erysipelothrix rhusiopathiae SY1027]AMS11095.1 polysaccharide deacetylase [Erysipelothrix rhusiopathiae]AOO67593.1 polysaccharide deacetylase [Erysipelothrix rhusiopathiae]EFY09662.1 polysaccharide deacetylase [Erysipelothrix rhusiopathiae ATCC 19414]MDE8283999.1 polysaccharide deacetylase family protein [Erysipelothrix rhusiopathiae]